MSTETPRSSPKKRLDSYIKFSAMGLQMGLTILCMTWAGLKLDRYLELTFPAFTLVFALSSVTGVMYYFIRQVTKK